MNINNIHTVYFIGIGGIGMSNLARYYNHFGKKVYGYDKTATPLTQQLEKEGITITYDDAIETLPQLDQETSLIVYTPAVPSNHVQKNYLYNKGFHLYKRSEVLGIITENTFCLAVSGTHGKTSTTSLLGHILHANQVESTAFLGGICENYNSNLLLGGNKISVVEADEFDRSFLKLSPNVIAITSMDADHLDIYGEHDALIQSFEEFAAKLTDSSKLITKKGLPIQGITYAIEEKADFSAQNIRVDEGSFNYDVVHNGKIYPDFSLSLAGRHNIENALAATAMAREVGLSFEQIRQAIASFKGIKRRFSIHTTQPKVYIDDYAHHPTEINAIINGVRELYPTKKILGIFQPHLFSRTRDFMEEFATSLSTLDALVLLDIYPARELPIEGITSEVLLNKITLEDKMLAELPNVLDVIQSKDFDVLVTIGAGDIDTIVEPIKKWLNP